MTNSHLCGWGAGLQNYITVLGKNSVSLVYVSNILLHKFISVLMASKEKLPLATHYDLRV